MDFKTGQGYEKMNARNLSVVDLNQPLENYTIFIPISAFNEDYIILTIEEALKKADYPNRISFGVWEHRTEGDFSNLTAYDNVFHATLKYPVPLGVGVARLNAFALYNQEDFILQIDAHTLFTDHWDTVLLTRWIEIHNQEQNSKILITNYMPSWGLIEGKPTPMSTGEKTYSKQTYDFNYHPVEVSAEDGEKIQRGRYFQFGTFIWKNKNATYTAGCEVFRLVVKEGFATKEEAVAWAWHQGNSMWNEAPIPNIGTKSLEENEKNNNFNEHYWFSAHFVFTQGSFIYEIAPDPFITFYGEEHTTALRAWTRGYQIFAITDSVIWHLNKSTINNPLDRTIINQQHKPERMREQDNYRYKEQLSTSRSQNILNGEITGFWGATTITKWKEYQIESNFDFTNFFDRLKREGAHNENTK